MQDKSLKSRITAGRFTLPVASLMAAGGWVLSGEWHTGWPMACMFLTAYLLVLLNNCYSLIRVRASLQSSIYLMLTGSCAWMHHPVSGWYTGVAFVLSLFLFFRCYRHPEPQADLFHSFLVLGIGILCWPPLLILVPCYGVGAYFFQAIHLRSVAASVTGLLLPCIFYLGYAYYTDSIPQALEHLQTDLLFPGTGWEHISTQQWAIWGYLMLLFIVSTFHLLTHSYDEKYATRSRLHFLLIIHLLFFALSLLQPAWMANLLCLLPIGVSILAGHYFVLSPGRFTRYFFLFMLALLACLSVDSLWR